ncbi:unnamed protein product [Acanthosepion pharaonis]|uniref:Uncharacterized protein n=1 Tax=Acanthosepion pharaonis TaxID=158019 RepID=A0A812AV59_ACAPH|nr:unnamed protein product [Sepia pharaonis]
MKLPNLSVLLLLSHWLNFFSFSHLTHCSTAFLIDFLYLSLLVHITLIVSMFHSLQTISFFLFVSPFLFHFCFSSFCHSFQYLSTSALSLSLSFSPSFLYFPAFTTLPFLSCTTLPLLFSLLSFSYFPVFTLSSLSHHHSLSLSCTSLHLLFFLSFLYFPHFYSHSLSLSHSYPPLLTRSLFSCSSPPHYFSFLLHLSFTSVLLSLISPPFFLTTSSLSLSHTTPLSALFFFSSPLSSFMPVISHFLSLSKDKYYTKFCFCKRKLYFPRVSIQFLFPFSLPSLPHPFLSLDSLPYLFIFLISNSLSSNLLTCSPHTIAFSPASASLTSFPKVVVPLI